MAQTSLPANRGVLKECQLQEFRLELACAWHVDGPDGCSEKLGGPDV